jgi:TolA-binding protein
MAIDARAGRPCHVKTLFLVAVFSVTLLAAGMAAAKGKPALAQLAAAAAPAPAESAAPAAADAPAGEPGTLTDRERRLAGRRDARANREASDLFRTADTTYLVGDLDRAAELYQRILTTAPGSSFAVRAQARLGDCAYELKRFDEAVQNYRRASQAADADAEPEERDAAVRSDYMVGQTYLAAKQYTAAFGNFRRFIDRHPDHALVNKAYQSIGDAHLALEQYQQALRAYRMVGTVIAEKLPAHRRVTPGQRLYLRVTDADVNISDTPKSVPIVIKTSGGDVEEMELHPLGLRSPLFIATIPTALGEPRHSGELKKAFSEDAAQKVRAAVAEADRLDRMLEEKSKALQDIERSPSKDADPAGHEKQRAKAAKEVEVLTAHAKASRAAALAQVDDAYAAVEKLVAEWAPEQSIDAITKRAGAAAQPAGAANKVTDPRAGELQTGGDVTDPDAAKTAATGAEDFGDDPSAGAAVAAPGGAAPRRGMTQAEIDRIRLEVKKEPATAATLDKRLTALLLWTRALHGQFQALEVNGSDTIEVAYRDEVGPGGPNAANEGKRLDTIEVASDAHVSLLTPDGQETIAQAVLGAELRLRVEDLDRDVSPKPDMVAVTLAAVVKKDAGLAALHAETNPDAAKATAAERSTPGEVPATGPATKPVDNVPLVPEGAESITVTLTETGPHTGIFERVIPLAVDKIALEGDAKPLPLDPAKQLRLAYKDDRAIRNPDGFVLAESVECIADRGGEVAAVKYRQTSLDLQAKLKRAVSAGEVGKIYLDLGLATRGRQYLTAAQGDCAEVANAAADSALCEEALYHSWRIYFYAGLLDDSVAAAQLLMGKYPLSEYVDDAMLAIGKVSVERGEKVADEAKAAGQQPGLNQDLQRAVAQLEQLVTKYPNSPLAPEALFLVGRAKIAAGQTGLDAFERLAKRYPDSGFAGRGLIRAAHYYVGVGDYTRAQEYFGRVLIDYPDSPQLGEVLLYKGVCQYKQGESPDALRTFYQVAEEHTGTELAETAQKYINFISQKAGENQ